MSTEQHETEDPLRLRVRDYKPSTFQLSEFEVVARGETSSDFSAAEWVCLGKAEQAIDPMFEVFESEDIPPPPAEESTPEVSDDEGETETLEASLEAEPAEDPQEVAPITDARVEELEAALAKAQQEREALEVEHARQLEELKAQVAEEVRQEVEKASDERVKAIEERYATLIEDMNTQITEGIEGVERRAVEFAVQIAKKLVGTIVEVNPEYILGIIKEATKLTGGATIKAIRVSPQDLEFLKMLSPDKQFKEFDGSWSFQADETIHAGCVLETTSGEVEIDLDKAWERIKESVIKVR